MKFRDVPTSSAAQIDGRNRVAKRIARDLGDRGRDKINVTRCLLRKLEAALAVARSRVELIPIDGGKPAVAVACGGAIVGSRLTPDVLWNLVACDRNRVGYTIDSSRSHNLPALGASRVDRLIESVT